MVIDTSTDQYTNARPLTVIPFKNRKINTARSVQVYRNLNSKDAAHRWSIRQNSLVVAHASQLLMTNVTFYASKSGMKRAQKLGHKIVCAYAKGHIVTSTMGIRANGRLPFRVQFEYPKGFNLKGAVAVAFNQYGATAAYTYE